MWRSHVVYSIGPGIIWRSVPGVPTCCWSIWLQSQIVVVILICPLILFIDNFVQIHYAARPNSSTSFPTPPPLFVTERSSRNSTWRWSKNEMANWISFIEDVDNKTREAGAIIAEAEKPDKQVGPYQCRWTCSASWNLPVMYPSLWQSLRLSKPCLMRSLVFVLGSIYDHWPFCLYIAGHILVEVDQYIMCFGTSLGWDTDPGSFVSGEKVPLSSLLFWMILDEFRCGHFAVMWSFSSWSSEDWSTKSSFFAIIPATLLFCAKLAVTNLLPAIDTKSGTSVYISFPFLS